MSAINDAQRVSVGETLADYKAYHESSSLVKTKGILDNALSNGWETPTDQPDWSRFSKQTPEALRAAEERAFDAALWNLQVSTFTFHDAPAFDHSELRHLQGRVAAITTRLTGIEEETQLKLTSEFDDFEQTARWFEEKNREYHKLYKEWVACQRDQLEILRTTDQADGYFDQIDEQLQTFEKMFEEMDRANGPTIAKKFMSVFTQRAESLVPEWILQWIEKHKEIQLTAQQANAILQKIALGEEDVTPEDLALLHKHMQNKLPQQLMALQEDFYQEFHEKVKQYPMAAKVIVGILSASVSSLCGGRDRSFDFFTSFGTPKEEPFIDPNAGAFGRAANTAVKGAANRLVVGKLFDQIIPESDETLMNRSLAGMAEVAGAYLLGGGTAALASIANQLLKTAPKPVQDGAQAAAFTWYSHWAGFSPFWSLATGGLSVKLLKNSKFSRAVLDDLQHVWQILQDNPLSIVPKFATFVVQETMDNFKGIVKGYENGVDTETVTRVAILTFGILGVMLNWYTLPLLLPLFYLTNRAYGTPFEGELSLSNPECAAYIANQYNKGDKGFEELIGLLKLYGVDDLDLLKDETPTIESAA